EFFFYQAEDGIRDRNVTGVQTCALPISFRKHATDADVGLLCGFSIAAKGETLFATPLEAWENGGMDTVNAPETLWHYTDTNGLLGILSSKLLMASSATYLNDAAELSYGKYCLADALYPIAERLGWRNH